MLSTILAFLAAPLMFAPAKEASEKPKIDDPASIDGMIAFFESKPANKTYNWASPGYCALAQWGQSMGGDYGTAIKAMDKWGHKESKRIAASAYVECAIALNSNVTFGAAAKRARAYKRKYNL